MYLCLFYYTAKSKSKGAATCNSKKQDKRAKTKGQYVVPQAWNDLGLTQIRVLLGKGISILRVAAACPQSST